MNFVRPAAFALAALLVVGCGDDSTGPDGDDNSMSASIAGTAWTGTLAVVSSYNSNAFSLSGTNGTFQIAIVIPNVTAAGTFNIGVGNLGIAQVIQVTGGTPTWTSALVGGTGTVTITTLTAEGATGTFSFNGIASPGTSATGTKAVTNGTFDVKF